MNSDYDDTQNWNWLFKNHVHAACENAVWDDQLRTEVWMSRVKERDSELNDADEKW